MTNVKSRMTYLDGLRGLAALCVVCTHFAGSFFPAALSGTTAPLHSRLDLIVYNTPLLAILGGNYAVCIFFVLSGYVLTFKFFKTGDKQVLLNASVKRYARLLIPAGLSVFIAYALLRLHVFQNQETATITGSQGLAALWNFPAHVGDAVYQAFYGVFISGQTTYNPLLWTMHVELIGSFIVFAVCALFGQYVHRKYFYLALLIIFFKTYFLGFIIGMMLADFMARKQSKIRDTYAVSIGIALISLGIFWGSYPSTGTPNAYFHFLHVRWLLSSELVSVTHTLGAGLLISGVIVWEKAHRILSNRIFTWLGKISFSLYIIHLLVIGTLASYLFNHFNTQFGYKESFAFTFLISLPVILLVSTIYSKYVDAFAIRYSNNLVIERKPSDSFISKKIRKLLPVIKLNPELADKSELS